MSFQLTQLYELLSNLLLSGIFFGVMSAITAAIISPLQFLKIMRQQTGKLYYKIFNEVLEKSGFITFFRGVAPYALMQFLSSLAFGFAEYITLCLLKVEALGIILALLIRATLGGIIETAFSLYSELKEITRNKGELMQKRASARTVLAPILIRNIIFWFGAVIAYEISAKYCLNLLLSSIIGFLSGAIFALISLPFDIIATQNCGALEQKSLIRKFKEMLQDHKSMLSGGLVRIIQIGIFTLVTVLSISLFQKINLGSSLI